MVSSEDKEVEKVKAGKIGPHLELSYRLDGILLTKSTKKCICKAKIDVGKAVEDEIGGRVVQTVHDYDGKIKVLKAESILAEKVVNKKITLDAYCKEQLKLTRQEQEWNLPTDVSHSAHAYCPVCGTRLGEVTATIRMVNAPEPVDLTRAQLANLEPSREMLAFVSKRMNFSTVDELKAWLDDSEANKAKQVLENAIAELGDLNLSYEASKISSELRLQIGKIDQEMHRRRMELFNAVEKIVQERTPIIR